MSYYTINTNVPRLGNDGIIPCSSTAASPEQALPCCQGGDTCLGNAICHFAHPQSNKASGFYVGSCTQESFPGPSCSMQCTDNLTSGIVYNSITALWACCYGSGSLDCSVPSPETFQAPSPQQLLADLAPSSSSSSSSKSKLAFPFSSFTAPSASPSTQSSARISSTSSRPETCPSGSACPPHTSTSLSTGAKVGFGLGLGIGIVGALVGIGLAVLALKKRNSNKNERLGNEPAAGAHGDRAPDTYSERQQAVELNAKPSVELDSSARVEMDAIINNRHEMQ